MKPVLLIVDDDPQVLQAVGIDLRQKYGDRFRVLKADSGATALDILKQLKLRNEPLAKYQDLRGDQMPIRREHGVEVRIGISNYAPKWSDLASSLDLVSLTTRIELLLPVSVRSIIFSV